MKYVKPIDPVTTWHLLQDNPENAAYYASSLIKSNKPEDFKEHYWFPKPEDPGDPQHHTPIQKRILSRKKIQNVQLATKRTTRRNDVGNALEPTSSPKTLNWRTLPPLIRPPAKTTQKIHNRPPF